MVALKTAPQEIAGSDGAYPNPHSAPWVFSEAPTLQPKAHCVFGCYSHAESSKEQSIWILSCICCFSNNCLAHVRLRSLIPSHTTCNQIAFMLSYFYKFLIFASTTLETVLDQCRYQYLFPSRTNITCQSSAQRNFHSFTRPKQIATIIRICTIQCCKMGSYSITNI